MIKKMPKSITFYMMAGLLLAGAGTVRTEAAETVQAEEQTVLAGETAVDAEETEQTAGAAEEAERTAEEAAEGQEAQTEMAGGGTAETAGEDSAADAEESQVIGELAFAQCEEYINIRSGASTENEVTGKIYNNGSATVLAQEGDWYKIQSGNAVGYVKAEYFATGEAAEEIARAAAYNVAVVHPDELNIRSNPDTEAEAIGVARQSEELEVVDYQGDWMKVALGDDVYGYVNAYYVDYKTYYPTAETLEEEQARLAAENGSGAGEAYAEPEASYEEAEAEDTEPAYAEPEYAEPEAPQTEPVYAEPEYTETEAPQTEPVYTEPVYTEPEYTETEAPQTEPVYTEPEYTETEAPQTEPVYTEPEYTETEAPQTEPVYTEPEYTETEAPQTEPVYTEPEYTETEAPQTEPVYTEPEYTETEPEYTETEAPASSGVGQQIADYAVQFVGNPYQWGGTSLTNGADCSGFAQSVFANFGISLARVAADQSYGGTSVSTDSLLPGDLVFYGSGGIDHVAIYIGGGQIVHAANSSSGIIISSCYYDTPVCARRYW